MRSSEVVESVGRACFCKRVVQLSSDAVKFTSAPPLRKSCHHDTLESQGGGVRENYITLQNLLTCPVAGGLLLGFQRNSVLPGPASGRVDVGVSRPQRTPLGGSMPPCEDTKTRPEGARCHTLREEQEPPGRGRNGPPGPTPLLPGTQFEGDARQRMLGRSHSGRCGSLGSILWSAGHTWNDFLAGSSEKHSFRKHCTILRMPRHTGTQAQRSWDYGDASRRTGQYYSLFMRFVRTGTRFSVRDTSLISISS